jgi:hypothetical protein
MLELRIMETTLASLFTAASVFLLLLKSASNSYLVRSSRDGSASGL